LYFTTTVAYIYTVIKTTSVDDARINDHIGSCAVVQELYNEFVPPALPDYVPRKPVLISFHDDARRRLGHLESMNGLDPLSAERDVLRHTQFAQSLSGCRTPLDQKVAAERAARFHALLTHCLQREHISSAGALNRRRAMSGTHPRRYLVSRG